MGEKVEKEKGRAFITPSGIELQEFYKPSADFQINYEGEIADPGEFPYTRGIRRNMYRGRLWTMRQYAGYGSAEESNARYRYLLSQGTTGLSVAFDLPTQIGLDSDDPLSKGEVGKVGVAIDTLEDMLRLFDEIPLDKVSTSMTINSTASTLLCMYLAVAKKQNVGFDKLNGTIQNDILKEYIARGTYIYPIKPSMRLITDAISYCSNEVPHWNTISISGYHIREAGSTAAQEIGFTLANAIAYIQAALDVGMNVDEFAPRLSFFFNAHNNLLEEISKFRAARRLWAKIMRTRFSAKDSRSLMMRFHTQTAGSTLTAQQPEVNVVRTTIQALSAVLGGTQSLHTNSMDEALGLPTEDSARLALRTQQVIAYESGVTDTVDPLAGSYAIESMTTELEDLAKRYIEKIDNMGGMIKAIECGYVQREIQDAAYCFQKEVESKERIVVGVNQFQVGEETEIPVMRIDERVEQEQIERVRAVRSKRNSERVTAALVKLEETAKSDENLLPRILDCVEAEITVGEISNTLRKVWGEYQESLQI
jgi:methylmalonyl-CoA mutase N-terminal domain/subunit